MSARASTAVPQSRIEALRSRHAILSGKIEEAHKAPSTTDFYLKQLKKQKLVLKQEIETLQEEASSA